MPAGAVVGDVVRVEADFEVDGIFVTKVLPAKHRSGRAEPERIEMISVAPSDGGVTARLAKKSKPRPDRPKKKGKRDRRDKARTDEGRDDAARDDGERDDDKRADAGDGARKRERPRGKQRRRDDAKPALPPRPRAKRLRPKRKHRDAYVNSLPPEQQAIAAVLMGGGLAAVRDQLNASSAGDQAPDALGPGNPDELLALAESLLTELKHAEWRDRADAALNGPDDLDLRDLRSVLVAADDHARDTETREIADQLRARLNAGVEATQVAWHDELRALLKDGRVVRALNVSSHNPKAGAPLPPEIARDLTAQTNSALGAGVSERRLSTVLEAASFSPIRPYVVVASPPENPGEELLATARKIARRMPEVAASLGVTPKASAEAAESNAEVAEPNVETADPNVEVTQDTSAPAS